MVATGRGAAATRRADLLLPGRSAHRPEIDGLRALAVLAVVAYHAEVPWIDGGFVGVDVFFVISGYLITGLLVREVEARGRLSVAGFYGRRARRLLPVAALVSVTTVAVGWWVLSPLARPDLSADALATSTYTINLRLAAQQLDYLRATVGPSAFRQFWSLAVEEQFYLVWPLVLLVVLRGAGRRRRAAGVVLAICIGSFALAVRWSATSPAWAFYSLPTRAWQLGFGALLALAWPRLEAAGWLRPRRAGQVLGLVTLAVVVVLVGRSTPWPSWWTLAPTAATVLVLAGPTVAEGGSRAADGLAVVPLRWIGVRSYSWYLWHWPAMVLLAAALDRGLGGWPALVAAVGTLVLADLTHRVVEQPVRTAPWLVASARRSVLLGLGVTLVLVALFAGLLALPDDVEGPGPSAAALAQRRVDARRLDQAALVDLVPRNLRPPLDVAGEDAPESYADGCHLDLLQVTPHRCRYGDLGAATTVVLFGDSHAAQWLPAFDRLGRARDVAVVSLTKSGCPAAELTVHDGMLERDYDECDRWRAQALDAIQDLEPALIVVAQTANYVVGDDQERPDDDTWARALRSTLEALDRMGPVVLLGDNPPPKGEPPDCLAEHLRSARACVLRRERLDPAWAHADAVAVDAATEAGIPFVEVTDLVCGDEWCPVMVGDQLVYRDSNHLTTGYARGVAGALGERLAAVAPAAGVLTG